LTHDSRTTPAVVGLQASTATESSVAEARGMVARKLRVAAHHFFDFFDLPTPSCGFGVTSSRHEERAAKTPW
jgi:hypothetical protein